MQPDPLDTETPWRNAIAAGLRDILRVEPSLHAAPPPARPQPLPGFTAIAGGLATLTVDERERLAVVLIGMIRADRDHVVVPPTVEADII